MLEGPFEQALRSIVGHAGANTVFGAPVTAQGKTIVPVAAIRYGFGGGSGRRANSGQHGGGGGGGVISRPIGVVEITPTQTRFVAIHSEWSFLAAIGVGLCLGWLAMRR